MIYNVVLLSSAQQSDSVTHTCACCHFSRVWLLVTLWTATCQAPLSMGFSRQEYWSGLPCPFPGNISSLGIKPTSLISPSMTGEFFTTSTTWETPICTYIYTNINILFQILSPYRLLWKTEYSSLCYTVGAWWLCILYIVVCIC